MWPGEHIARNASSCVYKSLTFHFVHVRYRGIELCLVTLPKTIEASPKVEAPYLCFCRRKTHLVQYIDDEDDLRRSFYQALLEIKWLPSKIQSAVMSELGLSLQKQKRHVENARTQTLKFLVDQCKARMRGNGERPRGGIHDAAVAEVAGRQGMKPEALKQRITRINKRPRK